MTSDRKTKQELLVGSVIVALFAILTLVAINLNNVRKSPLPSSKSANDRSLEVNNATIIHPGIPVVLSP